jgi:hypothetical protein
MPVGGKSLKRGQSGFRRNGLYRDEYGTKSL